MAPLLAIVGPTCTGKTGLAVQLARLLAPAELINADSRQVVRGLRVGTCAPSSEELQGVPCHLLGVRDPGEPYTAADWVSGARHVLDELDAHGALGVVVGGTWLYVTALVDGLDFGSTAPSVEVRAARDRQAAEPGGLAGLAAELRRRDPEGGSMVDLRNPRRVVRALEILDAHPEGLARARGRGSGREAVLLGLDLPADVHREWIERRASRMFESGALIKEVQQARARGVDDETLAGCGIGYAEAIDVLEGRLGEVEACAAITRRTLRYARSQRSYWRRDQRVEWLDPREMDAAALAQRLGQRLGRQVSTGWRAL
ncbi:MAG TPA: tRNA (adenosine(37)-N6)-dimethylallyltransferase MiaA [Candidatus Dormibacteraeota bacterium]|nr:tRNA (adenosine(37)-N6)-dimethylallyltransferase MiaA [Candidatus Dormibacteraeota bacterium]